MITIVGVRESPTEKGSTNYFFDFTVKHGPGKDSTENVGKKSSWMVSGGGLAAGIDDLCRAYVQFLVAITGLKPEEVLNQDIPNEFLVGKDVWAKIKRTPSQDGKLYPNFEMCSPADVVPF